MGTDEEAIAEILTTRSRPHLNAVFKEFKQVPNLRCCHLDYKDRKTKFDEAI